ncbi:MAG: hypothetical protein ACRED5_18470 [Propylenella sp.]
MKVTLDLGKLLAEGKITQEEHDRLLKLGAAGTGSLAFNILIGFGVIAVAGGAVALVPDPLTGIVIGLVVLGTGLALHVAGNAQWALLGSICILVGALGLAGGIVVLDNASVASFLAITIGFAIAGAFARSGLLIAGSVLALSSCLGARTDYMHATYFLGIEEPTTTIIVFSLLALVTYLASKALRHDFERLALVAARTSLLLVNLGFWIGSLWGDTLESIGLTLSDEVFVVLWAIALIGVGVWAAWANRRWVVNLAAVFGAIHFYTQWFERLGAAPVSILVAGLIALGLALALWRLNQGLWEKPAHP